MLLRRLRKPVALCVTLFVCAVAAQGQSAKPSGVKKGVVLTIDGAVTKPLKLTLAELNKLPQRAVQIKEPDGATSTYEGPVLADVLSLAGVVFGEDLKGARLKTFLLSRGADDFQAVFALPELDATFTDHLIVLASRRDGQPLAAAEGPLRIIVPGEKRRSRWVKQVTTLRILDAAAGATRARASKR